MSYSQRTKASRQYEFQTALLFTLSAVNKNVGAVQYTSLHGLACSAAHSASDGATQDQATARYKRPYRGLNGVELYEPHNQYVQVELLFHVAVNHFVSLVEVIQISTSPTALVHHVSLVLIRMTQQTIDQIVTEFVLVTLIDQAPHCISTSTFHVLLTVKVVYQVHDRNVRVTLYSSTIHTNLYIQVLFEFIGGL